MSHTEIDISRFIGEPSNILERLYKEPQRIANAGTFEDFLMLPKNELYIKNELEKSKEELKKGLD